MALTKIYRVALIFYFKQIRYFDLGSRISGVVTQSSEKDFENKFPTDDELDNYIKEQKQIAINRLGDNFEYLKNETTITEFVKYI